MKATLEFDMPDDAFEHEIAVKAMDMFMVICELDNWLRSEIKYNNKAELQSARDRLSELINDRRIAIE